MYFLDIIHPKKCCLMITLLRLIAGLTSGRCTLAGSGSAAELYRFKELSFRVRGPRHD